ncbi:hypothetical protein GMRT_12277 [Giardia muris]|uniref:EF-hand domain-containing protein n=1 Tax=Giardia muris TaxID=5742 RepID=A0A4Z1TBE1_GIAMU|nr:hypothetical protein GMRT_12277 [Giardia muris]|eukprot:TNJ30567.1 hypothetical protein GMRT_12277 [Giardia muris]
MRDADALLTFVRQKMMENTSSTQHLFRAVDADGDGLVSPQDFCRYCSRFSLPSNVLTEERINGWFSLYTTRCAPCGVFLLKYPEFRCFVEAEIETVDAPSPEPCQLVIGDIRRQLVRLAYRLGYSVPRFYGFCTNNTGFLYDHHLREILSRYCGQEFSDSDWQLIWAHIKADKRKTYISQQDFAMILSADQHSDLEPSKDPNKVLLDVEATGPKLVKVDQVREFDSQLNELRTRQTVDQDVDSVLFYLAQRLQTVAQPRILFTRLDVRRCNYLLLDDFLGGIRTITDIEVDRNIGQEIFRALGVPDGEAMSYQAFLRLLHYTEERPDVRIGSRPSSAAALHRKKIVDTVPTGQVQRSQVGRRRLITSQYGGSNIKEALEGSYSPNNETSFQELLAATQGVRPASAIKSTQKTPSVTPRTVIRNVASGDAQRYTTTTLNTFNFDTTEKRSDLLGSCGEQLNADRIRRETLEFKREVVQRLASRGTDFGTVLSAAFGKRRLVSGKELIWLLRARLGIGVSPHIILQAFSMKNTDTISCADLISFFTIKNLRPRSTRAWRN